MSVSSCSSSGASEAAAYGQQLRDVQKQLSQSDEAAKTAQAAKPFQADPSKIVDVLV
jgi:hypothetical protein